MDDSEDRTSWTAAILRAKSIAHYYNSYLTDPTRRAAFMGTAPQEQPLPTASEIFNYHAQSKTVLKGCPSCGSAETMWLQWGQDRFGFNVMLATCATCQLTYLTEQMTREGYERFYAGPYRKLTWQVAFPGEPFDEEKHRAKLVASQRIYAELLIGWLKHVPVPSRPLHILDAGGSTGVVGEMVAAAFAAESLHVLDPAAQELPEQNRIVGYLEDPIPCGGPYDLILCCETADHLMNPRAALTNMRKALAPGGLLYIDVVDKATWAVHNAIKIDHPLYWSKKSLLYALDKAGFTQVKVQRFMHSKRWKVRAVCQV